MSAVDVRDKLLANRKFTYADIRTDVLPNAFAYVKGRMFNRWVDSVSGGARSNGKNENDLIEMPCDIIESLLRDENFTERDLTLEYVSDNTFYVDGLISEIDDYYDYSIVYNVSKNEKDYVTDYVYTGGHKRINTSGAHAGWQTGDFCFLTNIQGDLKIDITSFDTIGNTTNGTRKDWVFARSFIERQNVRDTMDELCFESHCELVESINPASGVNQFKLIAIDSGSGDTWTNPAYSGGLEQITARLSPLENIFTKFRLRYYYDYAKGDFLKEKYVDKNGIPVDSVNLDLSYAVFCSNAEINYGMSQLFEHSSMNIYDDATAEYFLMKKIAWFTKQRLLVDFITPIVGNADWIKYEVGDQVKLNFSRGIPTGLNNSSLFMVTGKQVQPLIGGGRISWGLIEL